MTGDDESSKLSVSTSNSLYKDPNEVVYCGYLNPRYVTFAATPSCLRKDPLYVQVKNFNTLVPHELIGEAKIHLDIMERYRSMEESFGIDTEYRADITKDASLEIKGEPTVLLVCI